MANIVVVYGPPCAGKTTYVAEHREDSDVVIDMDALAVALGSPTGHDHTKIHIQAAAVARDALIERYVSKPGWASRVWIIQTKAADVADYPAGVEQVKIATDRDVCHERARRVGRDRSVHEAIDRWWNARDSHAATTPLLH